MRDAGLSSHKQEARARRKERGSEREREREKGRLAIAPSHLRLRVEASSGAQADPYKRGLQDIRGASVLKPRNGSNHEGICGE